MCLPWISISSRIKCKVSLPSKVWSGSWRIIAYPHLPALFSCSFYSSHPSFLEPAKFTSVSGSFVFPLLGVLCTWMFAWLTSLLCLYLLSNFSCSERTSWLLYFHWQAIYRKCCWTPSASSQSTPDVFCSLGGQFPVHAESLFPLFVSLQEGFLRPQEFTWLVGGVGWKY